MDKQLYARVHFTDPYGQGCVTCDVNSYSDLMSALRADPNVEDIWVEYYDDETGWTV